MLRELDNVRQVPGEGRRRWFADERFDLVVWYEDQDVVGFQLCYDKDTVERAITWYRTGSFVHARVDDGEIPYAVKSSPVLVSDGVFDAERIATEFREAASRIDPTVAELVCDRLSAYPGD